MSHIKDVERIIRDYDTWDEENNRLLENIAKNLAFICDKLEQKEND